MEKSKKLVVFVADEPSRLNVNKDIAFVGAKCFTNVINWINYLKPDYYVCINSNTNENINTVIQLQESGFKVVAMGVKACERLCEYSIKNFLLPHPSPKNFILNNKEMLKIKLDECKEYINVPN